MAEPTTDVQQTPPPDHLNTDPVVVEPKLHITKAWRVVGVVFLCFVGSFLGAWLLLVSGLVHFDASQVAANRQTIVLQQGEVVSQVFKTVDPSTVAITTESVDTSKRFLAQQQVSEGAGSGIILSKDGYVMTNKHVVPAGVNKLTVITSDGKQYTDVKVVGRDPSNDIAFLKINGVSNLTPASLGDSGQVAPGQQVVAIGNALGLFRNSVTSGIVSGLGRPVQASDGTGSSAEQLEDLIQTDAAINPGNSGGPLVNLKGEVIGMNTAISQDGQSIGFAIPINDAKGEINAVLKTGQIAKAYLGVRYVSIDPDVATQLNLSVTQGALVHSGSGQPAVVAGSPAARANLQDGDIITKVNGQQITPASGLATKLAQFNPGDKVDLTVLRGGQERTITVTLDNYPG